MFYFSLKEKKIQDQLDKAVQQQLCKLKKQSKMVRKNQSLKTITSDDKMFNIILEDNGTCQGNCKVDLQSRITNTNKITTTKTNGTDDTAKLKEVPPKLTCNKTPKHCDFDESNPDCAGTNTQENTEGATSFKPNCTKMCDLPNDKIDVIIKPYNINDHCNVNDSDTLLDAVFNRPTKHKPYQFDYQKIFASKPKDKEKISIRQMFLAALDETPSNLPAETDQSHRTYDEAVRKCAQKTFNEELIKYQKEKKSKVDALNTEKFNPLGDYSPLSLHNAENFVLMEKLLFDAFQYLRRDPKFVWAQLPDAHRVPSLREWIARRFGKVYPPAERIKSYRMSCIVFGALDKSKFNFSLPTANYIGKNYFLNYNCRSHIERKVMIYSYICFAYSFIHFNFRCNV